MLACRVEGASRPGPDNAWAVVRQWILDLIDDVRQLWTVDHFTVFIDCNPSFGISTELAMASAERLIIPFSADGSSRRAVRTVLSRSTARPGYSGASGRSSRGNSNASSSGCPASTSTSATA